MKRYFDAYNVAAQDPSKVGQLDKFTLPACKSCANLRAEVAGWGRKGAKQDGRAATLTRTRPSFSTHQKFVIVTIRQHAGTVRTADGKVVERIPEGSFYREVLLGWRDGWRIAKIYT